MKIFKAQKKVKRLKGEIADLQNRIQASMSTIKENEYVEILVDLESELDRKVDELIKFKVRIMQVNIANGMFQIILELGEAKSKLGMVKNLSTQTGLMDSGYRMSRDDVPTEYKSQLTVKGKLEKTKSLEEKIVSLTDQLDDFNAITNI